MTEALPWIALGLSLASLGAVAYVSRAALRAIQAERLERASPTLAPEVHRQPVRAADETWREWVAEGWTLAEASGARSQKENGTKPDAADKRTTAIGWVRQQSEKFGVEWGSPQAAHAAKLLELYHWKTKKEARDAEAAKAS